MNAFVRDKVGCSILGLLALLQASPRPTASHPQAHAPESLADLRFGAYSPVVAGGPVPLADRGRLGAVERATLLAEEAMFSKHPRTRSKYQRMHSMFTCLGNTVATPAVGWRPCRLNDGFVFLRDHLLPTIAGRNGPESDVSISTLHGLMSSLS